MSFKHVNGRGSLWRNDKKEKETSPDWKGDGMIMNQQVWISGWENDSAKGPYIKLSFQEKETNKPVEKPEETKKAFDFDDGDKIPF